MTGGITSAGITLATFLVTGTALVVAFTLGWDFLRGLIRG